LYNLKVKKKTFRSYNSKGKDNFVIKKKKKLKHYFLILKPK